MDMDPFKQQEQASGGHALDPSESGPCMGTPLDNMLLFDSFQNSQKVPPNREPGQRIDDALPPGAREPAAWGRESSDAQSTCNMPPFWEACRGINYFPQL